MTAIMKPDYPLILPPNDYYGNPFVWAGQPITSGATLLPIAWYNPISFPHVQRAAVSYGSDIFLGHETEFTERLILAATFFGPPTTQTDGSGTYNAWLLVGVPLGSGNDPNPPANWIAYKIYVILRFNTFVGVDDYWTYNGDPMSPVFTEIGSRASDDVAKLSAAAANFTDFHLLVVSAVEPDFGRPQAVVDAFNAKWQAALPSFADFVRLPGGDAGSVISIEEIIDFLQ